MNSSMINITDAGYPGLLNEIQGAPSPIFVRGTLPEGTKPTVAIVGTRKATKDGRELARKTAMELAEAGIVVVSGLAMGIDTEAHKGTLKAHGITVAVLGNGIDSVYPVQNERLAREILETGGAIISEYSSDEPSYKYRFIERNRIISGLSLGVVVIEAPEQSGALSTARFAGEQGRSIFVFPNAPHNKNYAGSHALIRDGATLVTKTDDILEDLGIEKTSKTSEKLKELDANEYKVLSVISEAGKPVNIDTIIELTTLEPHVVSNIITMLVIEGIIKEGNFGYEISNS